MSPTMNRDQTIATERAAGATLRAIGERHHLSPERVRQILIAQHRHAINGGWTIYTNGPYQCPHCTHPAYRAPSLLVPHLQREHNYGTTGAHDAVTAMIGEPETT